MQEFNIIINQGTANERNIKVNAVNAEMAVRSEMCWFSDNTLFTVDNITYKKVKSNDAIAGFSELIKLD